MYKYLFGPVPSRRLGMSLGIDLVPKKVCSLELETQMTQIKQIKHRFLIQQTKISEIREISVPIIQKK